MMQQGLARLDSFRVHDFGWVYHTDCEAMFTGYMEGDSVQQLVGTCDQHMKECPGKIRLDAQ